MRLTFLVICGLLGTGSAALAGQAVRTAPAAGAELGKMVYQLTMGTVGCATCHGVDATGDRAGNIRGKSAAEINAAIKDVKDMHFLAHVPASDIDVIAAYLATLD
jgi:cytochrome c553